MSSDDLSSLSNLVSATCESSESAFPDSFYLFHHSQAVGLASLGIRKSPRGDTATLPTLGPSGKQERLNCWLKNLQ